MTRHPFSLGYWIVLASLIGLWSPTSSTALITKDEQEKFYQDCQQAIDAFPIDPAGTVVQHEFHKDRIPDLYALPRKTQYESCQAYVTIRGNYYREYGTWEGIRRKFGDINEACRHESSGQKTAYTGLHNRFQLSLLKIGPEGNPPIIPVERLNLTLTS